MKIAHFSDLHYCQKHLEWVDKATGFAIENSLERGADVAVISGDSFDASIHLHEQAVSAYFEQIKRLAKRVPVLILQGTASHDRPGSLTPLRHIATIHHDIFVADTICQIALVREPIGDTWQTSSGFAFDKLPDGALVLFSCLPSINKGAIAAAVGAENAASQAGELVYDLCKGWSPSNLMAREAGIPTCLVSHGTVNGCVTEAKHAMVSPDHEFTSGTLFAAETSAVLLGHIHAHNTWEQDGRRIAYPGSITRLIHGHDAPTGYLLWNVQPDKADFEFIETPAKRLLEIDFDGPPDMDRLREAAAGAAGAYVRIRWSVDEDCRHSVDKTAITELFKDAADLKTEGHVNPVQRSRSEGINKAVSLHDKLGTWCEVTETKADPLKERLTMLESMDEDDIVSAITESKNSKEKAA